MATYNGGKFIREQVDSILNQELTENEGGGNRVGGE